MLIIKMLCLVKVFIRRVDKNWDIFLIQINFYYVFLINVSILNQSINLDGKKIKLEKL